MMDITEVSQALHPLHQRGEPRNESIHLFYYSSLGALFVCARVNTKYLAAAVVGPSVAQTYRICSICSQKNVDLFIKK